MKRIKSICSVLMVIVMMLSLFPGDVYAANEATDCVLDDEKLSVTGSEVLSEFESGNGPTVLYEDVSRRGRYEKHFVLSDGSYQAVVYNEPIHYATASGWEEVDNTLSLQDDLDGGKRYVTVDGLADVSFASSANDRLVTVKHDGYELSWNVRAVTSGKLTSQIATAELISLDRLGDEEKSAYLAERSSSAIRYRDALGKGADLEYVVLPSRVKENIILNSQQDIASYVITVYVDGLSARLLKDRRVEFVDQDGDVIFMMTSPYMYDSAGELSENIAVNLSSSERGVYVIHMTPDRTWLNDLSRVYPITIDPQVTTSTAQTNIVDNYVLEGAGNQNGSLDRVYIGRKSGTRARAFIKFTNMPTLPTGATVTAASMTTHIVANTSTGNTADAYMVIGGDWSANTITWTNMPSANGTLATSISHNSLTRYTFSCTYAVQTWYSGSSVGQNKNYGIMLRYHDESIADYNAVYSADHTTASQRPSIVITYQVASITSSTTSIVEGSSATLSPPETSGTVTWSSSDTAVATVNSSGRVTGVKAGKATVSASIGGVVQKTCTVYVVIPNGVYYLKNMSASLYLGTGGHIADGTVTQLLSKTSAGPAQIRQLWKITYLGDGYYSLRPMHKLDMALGLSGANVTIRKASTTDNLGALSSNCWWTISYDGSGYVVKYYGSNGVVMRAADGAQTPGLGVVVSAYSATNTLFKWNLEKLVSPPSGAYLYDTATNGVVTSPIRYIFVGETKTLSDLHLLPVGYGPSSNQYTFTWSGTTSALSVAQQTGTITAHSVPTGPVTVVGTSSCGSVQFKVYVLPIRDGTYRIRNRASNMLAYLWDPGWQADSIVQWAPLDDLGQEWIFTHLGEAVYSIRCADPSASYYMGVSGDSGSDGQAIVPRTGTLTSGMKWKIVPTTNGFCKIVPLTGESAGRVLAVESNSNGSATNGDLLQQRSYVAGVHEWCLVQEKDYALLYRGKYDGDPDMPPLMGSVASALTGNAGLIGFSSTAMTNADVRDHLMTSKLFSCVTHGLRDRIETTGGAVFRISDVNAIPDGALDDLELVCLTACRTGEGKSGDDNLVNALHSKGAGTVIGFTVNINTEAAEYWTDRFMYSLSQGNTIAVAMQDADTAVGNSDQLNDDQKQTVMSCSRHCVGLIGINPFD